MLFSLQTPRDQLLVQLSAASKQLVSHKGFTLVFSSQSSNTQKTNYWMRAILILIIGIFIASCLAITRHLRSQEIQNIRQQIEMSLRTAEEKFQNANISLS